MESSERRERLSAELSAALVREVQQEWRNQNYWLFQDAMRPPQLILVDTDSILGRFAAAERALSLSLPFVLAQPWPTVVEVLKHEMAHQFVFEVLRIADETAHGPIFRQVCEKRGIDHRAQGIPQRTAPNAEGPEDKILERVAKLLALAESPSKHESEAAMHAAQRLMLKYNLDRCSATAAAPSYRYRTVGTPTGRVTEAQRWLATILTSHFFVQGIWIHVYRPLEGKRGSVLEISGTHENLEMADYVHTFLMHAADQLWIRHKKDRGIRADRDRRTFLAGVMMGFKEKLDAQKREQASEGLVWLGDERLKEFYRARHPKVATAHFGGSPRTEARAEGQRAGHALVINKPMSEGPKGPVRLLGR